MIALLRRCGAIALAALCWQAVAVRASDVPYVPTPMNVVDAMLVLGGVGPGDYLIDLGSGDGRISIRAATRFGTPGMGVDIDDRLVRLAQAEAQKQGVAGKVAFAARNLFDTDLSRATVITAYLLHSVNLRLRPMLFEQLKPGTRVVSHDFDFADWPPDQKITIDVPDKVYGPPRSDIMLWVIPANFAGVWQWSLPGSPVYEARLEQKFQMLVGAAMAQGQPLSLAAAQVKGDTVSFTLNGAAGVQRYSGRIDGNVISGEVVPRSGERTLPWRAERIKTGTINIGGM
ncbi:MAG: class I SAM-dependent methyltransferase [Burkholderiales bacterium]|nr:class I SAM-dependent methyltransferase [Burkholderiales bacterium]